MPPPTLRLSSNKGGEEQGSGKLITTAAWADANTPCADRGRSEGERRRRHPKGSEMSVSVPPRAAPRKVVQERQRITSLPLYFDGVLCVKRGKQKDFIKYWAELRGTTLFLYADNKQEMHIEMIDLMDLKSLADFFPSNKQLTKVTLTLQNEEVQLKTDTPEDVEEWKGFILTVTQLSVPSRLALLPGQIIRLHEVLEIENSRRKQRLSKTAPSLPSTAVGLPTEDYVDVLSMPPCFYQVTRKEATDMLEQNTSFGNLILRPGGDNKNFSVSIRQLSDTPVVKHYKVLNTEKGYTIELEKPVTLSSLNKVVEYFMNETHGKLVPYISNMYDTTLEVLGSEPKKSEVPKQNKPQARVAPLVSQPVKKLQKSMTLELPIKAKIPVEEEDPNSTYMVADDVPDASRLCLGKKLSDGQIAGSISEELKDILAKRREKMHLPAAPAPAPRAGQRKT